MSVLVLVEHDNKDIGDATLNTVTAAQQIDNDIVLLVAGYNCEKVAKSASTIPGVRKIIIADNPAYQHALAENIAFLLAKTGADYSHILAPATSNGKNILPRAAALLNVCQISEIIEVLDENTFKRPIYAGNAIATVQSEDPIKVITVRTTNFEAAPSSGGSASIEALNQITDIGISSFENETKLQSDRPDLAAAKIVISGGRGMQNRENFEQLYAIADALGGAVGASRAAVDAGFASNNLQVGQTGKVIAPDLYIAVGISGAIQHLAGMKDSKVIVAINKDEEAPIFQMADYGLVEDLFTALPELERLVSNAT